MSSVCQFCNHNYMCSDCHSNFYDDRDPIEAAIQRTFIGSGEDVDLNSFETGPEISFQISDGGSNYEGGPSTRGRM